MTTAKCCKCGHEEACNVYHSMLEDGKYVCRNCAYKIRRRAEMHMALSIGSIHKSDSKWVEVRNVKDV